MIITFQLCSEIDEANNTGTVIDERWAIIQKDVNATPESLAAQFFAGEDSGFDVVCNFYIGSPCVVSGVKITANGVVSFMPVGTQYSFESVMSSPSKDASLNAGEKLEFSFNVHMPACPIIKYDVIRHMYSGIFKSPA